MKPTAERVRSLLIYDPTEYANPFTWQAWFRFRSWETAADYSRVGVDGYLQINIDGEFYRADELAWLIMQGAWPQHQMIHADGEDLNISWDNIKHNVSLPKAA